MLKHSTHNNLRKYAACAAGLALSLAPLDRVAHAYCITNGSAYLELVSGELVPVYLGGNLWTTGLSSAELEKWIKVAIDIINRASHDGPKLYFAGPEPGGVTQSPEIDWATVENGITIEGYESCSTQNFESMPGEFASTNTDLGRNKAVSFFARGGVWACNAASDDEHLKNNRWWVDPDHDDGSVSFNHDLVGVMVHELLHSLRLNHTDAPSASACTNGAVSWTYGAMWTSRKDFRRQLRRDDVEGLRAIYGEPERAIHVASGGPTSISWNAPAAIDPDLVTNTVVSASDAVGPNLDQILVGFTDTNDLVRVFSGTTIGWDTNAFSGGILMDNGAGASLKTFDRTEVALGYNESDSTKRQFVSWFGSPSSSTSGESTGSVDTRIWWRTFADGTWRAPQSSPLTQYKSMGASYDPHEDVFVLAYLDVWPDDGDGQTYDIVGDQRVFVRTINAVSGGGGCTQAMTTVGHVLEVGSVSCDHRNPSATRCVVPLSTTEQSGPVVRMMEGAITTFNGSICFVRDGQDDPLVIPLTTSKPSYGMLDSAMAGGTANGLVMFSYVSGFSGTTPGTSNYAKIFTMTRNASNLLTGTVANERTFPSNHWPISLGSMASGGTSTWRAFTHQ
ncbi:hypothetical protein [Nannocystis punicea]|uniref:Uncharacterized protein n=1 Tax=Nannocystis punicea TaxID=2995304 RepID=A0ABY7H4L9_9BACT|nr:hypothetical protein [Nannocystis poenicansa]WAS94212.1 hypothetical protein O0S08_49450 [Nannocystis poenicansa]